MTRDPELVEIVAEQQAAGFPTHLGGCPALEPEAPEAACTCVPVDPALEGAARAHRRTGEISAWNAEHPVGTPVLFWPGGRSGPGRQSTTRSHAWPLGDGTPVVLVNGYAGGIALTHVEQLRPWPGHCQSCGAVLTPRDARACEACGASDYDEGDSGPLPRPRTSRRMIGGQAVEMPFADDLVPARRTTPSPYRVTERDARDVIGPPSAASLQVGDVRERVQEIVDRALAAERHRISEACVDRRDERREALRDRRDRQYVDGLCMGLEDGGRIARGEM
jgi:hypothetical protein